MANPLFSTYRGGENRVTSSTMAVFQRIDLSIVQELLQNSAGMGDELRGVSFENQVVGEASVPDARISGRFTWWFETKTELHGYGTEGHNRVQVRSHSRHLVGDPDAFLFVLTPDASQPSWFGVLDGVDSHVRDRVVWFSFANLASAVRELLSDPTRLLPEQTRFLLSELVNLYEAEGLLSSDDTVIVAARMAWGEYQELGAYVCQPNRSFRSDITHFGFYAQGQIMPVIARIEKYVPAVVFSSESAAVLRERDETRLADLIEGSLERGNRDEGASYGIMLLSAKDAPDTIRLRSPIRNDTIAASGRAWAWTMGQRYTRLSSLMSGASRTSEL